MYAYLAKNYPEVTAGEAGGAAPPAADEPAADGAEEEAYDSELEEDDDEDYADFIPAKPVDKTKKRGSIVSEKVEVADDWKPPVYDKPDADTKFVTDILPKLFFLSGLTRKELGVLVGAMKEIPFAPGAGMKSA